MEKKSEMEKEAQNEPVKAPKWDIYEPWKTLDPWQEKYINTKGNCLLVCGRQVGKSAAASIKYGEIAAKEKKAKILMIAYTENQAYSLFFKTLMYLQARYPHLIKKGRWKPTKHEIYLTNGSQISCYACGLAGEGIRGKTLTHLVIDEAAAMSREVFIAVSPMLAVSGGGMDLISTPRGKIGFFYECSKRDDFTKFHVSSEDCPRLSKDFLEEEKKNMSRLEYAQEYLAQFLDDLRRFFSDEIIEKACILQRRETILPNRRYYCGVDLARMGGDEITFETIDKISETNIQHVESIIRKYRLITQTEEDLLRHDLAYNHKRIGLDAGAGSMGVCMMDYLMRNDQVKKKLIALNNRKVMLDRDEATQRLLKEDMYFNMLRLLERGHLKLLDDDEIKYSLASVQYEYVTQAKKRSSLRIFGNATHIAEGLVRAAWLATEHKDLNIWCHF